MTATEKEPLLGEKTRDLETGHKKKLSRSTTGFERRIANAPSPDGPVVDTMTYDSTVLKTWQVFWVKGVRCVWHKAAFWKMMALLMTVSFFFAVLVFFSTNDPGQVQGSKFKEIGLFLRVFVGLLLGFFLTSSVSRWYASVNGFMELFDAVRNMQMQLLALGVPAERRFQLIRYGYISGYLLDKTLSIARLMESKERQVALEEMWEELISEEHADNNQLFLEQKREMITAEEAVLLKEAEDPAGMMWYWVASLVGRLAQDGVIPPMASPTYGRIMNLAQTAHGGIRHVKQNVTVQAPFIYVHMLSALVHVNNLICAISFGISFGTTVSSMYAYQNKPIPLLEEAGYNVKKSSWKDVTADIENLVIMVFIGVFGPFLYQCLLEVSIEIAQPFANPECSIPTGTFLRMLKGDLDDAQDILKTPPGWEPPCFKPPAK